jgi:hypothetical protein
MGSRQPEKATVSPDSSLEMRDELKDRKRRLDLDH